MRMIMLIIMHIMWLIIMHSMHMCMHITDNDAHIMHIIIPIMRIMHMCMCVVHM